MCFSTSPTSSLRQSQGREAVCAARCAFLITLSCLSTLMHPLLPPGSFPRERGLGWRAVEGNPSLGGRWNGMFLGLALLRPQCSSSGSRWVCKSRASHYLPRKSIICPLMYKRLKSECGLKCPGTCFVHSLVHSFIKYFLKTFSRPKCTQEKQCQSWSHLSKNHSHKATTCSVCLVAGCDALLSSATVSSWIKEGAWPSGQLEMTKSTSQCSQPIKQYIYIE